MKTVLIIIAIVVIAVVVLGYLRKR